MRQIPFAAQWTLQYDEVKAIKNYDRLRSTSIITTGISYSLKLYPNGKSVSSDKTAVVHLGVNLGNQKFVNATYTIRVYSANFSTEDIHHRFESSAAYGHRFCDTRDLFDLRKHFFIDGKMVLKVSGFFEMEENDDDGQEQPESLGSLLWKSYSYKDFPIFADQRAREFKVHKFILGTQSVTFYKYFDTKPDKNKHEFCGYRYDDVILAMKVIYGCKEYFPCSKYLKKTLDYLKIPEFLNKNKGFNDDDHVYNPYFQKLGPILWDANSTKDVAIMVDGREIMAHKAVLAASSPKFELMLLEAAENAIKIRDFSFHLVEMAIKEIYIRAPNDCNVDGAMLLLPFFNEYDVPLLKQLYEAKLIREISIENVCRLTNCAFESRAWKLKENCMELLMVVFAAKTPLPDIRDLNKDAAMEIFQNSLSKPVFTIKEDNSSFN